MKNIFVTGRPRIGKTTLILKVLKELNLKANGFYTKEIREGTLRLGFAITNLKGETKTFAHVNFSGNYRVGKYKVDIAALEEIGVKVIEEGISKKQLIIIDEIGKMELYSDKFQKAVIKALDSKSPVLGTITKSQLPFVKKMKSRKDVKLLEMTEENRDKLVDTIKVQILSNQNLYQ
jgi:nucleoside-triphosphatase